MGEGWAVAASVGSGMDSRVGSGKGYGGCGPGWYWGWACRGSGDQAELGKVDCSWDCEGEGAVPEAESGGLGLPRIAERMEYSKFAASDPKVKFGSKETLKRGSFAGKRSAGDIDMSGDRWGVWERIYMWEWQAVGDQSCAPGETP